MQGYTQSNSVYSLQMQTTFGAASNLAQTQNSEVVFNNVDGYAGIVFRLIVPTGGTCVFEGSPDGTNYASITMRRVANDGYVRSTTTSDTFLGSIAGMRLFRVRVSVAGSAAGTVIGTVQRYQHTLEGIENGPPSDFETNLAESKVSGYSLVNKYGRNPDIDTATVPEDIWNGGGVYTGFPSQLETVQVFSSDANDTPAGTGARTVRITGLDTDYNVLQETITLNGTTPVNSVGQFRRVHTATVLTAGSGGVNVGTITCRHTTTTANVFFVMRAGINQTNVSAYTVPAGKTAYLRLVQGSIRSSTTSGVADGYIWTRPFGGVFRARRPFTIGSNAPLKDTIYGGIVFTEKSDIVMRIEAVSANNLDVSVGYDLILVDN